ncbi:MAG: hypothetical protein HW396_342 [Candidatus Dadabacteria bacterium]|nr:hypothetical protein [Candidatus Dadabacteria bacterium]
MRHLASPTFWDCYDKLPKDIQELADKCFELLKTDPKHPSLHFKKVGKFWSARVGIKYRALAVEVEEGLIWFWVGNHSDYERLVK